MMDDTSQGVNVAPAAQEAAVRADGVRLPCDWMTLDNVHPAEACTGRSCVIHNPSNHHMRYWRLHWRNDRGLFERICPHGIGHPDPDQFEHWQQIGRDSERLHGCDGCCRGEGPNIATYDWCDVMVTDCTEACECTCPPQQQDCICDCACDCTGPVLHAPHPNVVREFDDWDGDPVDGSSACGVGVKLLIPGVGSRLSARRCKTCCDLLGYPPGKGSPKNDAECRVILGMAPR